ncbi:MAG: ROK family protein [Actinomycetota bacterium]|nr:ROK family protein [Actinomycetota bacterium]
MVSSTPVVLGLDFGGTKVAAAACDLEGRQVHREVISTQSDQGAEAVLQRGLDAAGQLLDRLGRPPLAGIGVATIGVPNGRFVELAPAIPGWEAVPLAERVADTLGAPVRLANDVKAAAVAEARWGALAGADPALYVNLGTGLAAAIVVGGKVVTGAHGAAGEIGYLLLRPDDLDRSFDERPILEHIVSGMGLAAAGSRRLARPVSALEVFSGSDADPALAAVVDEFVAWLALHLVNLAVALDPERIAVGGGFVRSWSRFSVRIEQALKAGVPFPPALVPARHPYDAALLGALCLGITAAGRDLAPDLSLDAAAWSAAAKDEEGLE